MKKTNKFIKNRALAICGTIALSAMVTLTSCDPTISAFEYDLPDSNSKPDETPPSADFSSVETSDYLVWEFANGSVSATDYVWDFGDGSPTVTTVDAVHTFAEDPAHETEEGKEYIITLTASDKLDVVSKISQTIVVRKPEKPNVKIPKILEPGFEDLSLPDGTGDGRDSWKNSALGGVIQITSSPVKEGSQAAKFPSSGDRIGYQELEVSPNADYVLKYWYTLKTDVPGSITVSVLDGGGITDASTATVLGTYVGTDQTDADAYVSAQVLFNSGSSTTVSIYISNLGAEARVDDVSIEAAEL